MFKDRISKYDVEAIAKFSLMWPLALMMKPFMRDVWMISERFAEAQDNGYWLFKYICENGCHKNTYYIIKEGASDEQKVATLGKTIKAYSLKHYLYYLLATKHISSQIDGGMPNMRVCSFLERYGLLKNKKVFLQHGITKDVISFGFFRDTRVNLFVCATKREMEFVKETFGYPEGAVQQLGFARFDNLIDVSKGKKQILIMPTWRVWLAERQSSSIGEAKRKFLESEYYKHWSSLLRNEQLSEILVKYDYSLVFYPHSDMQPYVTYFNANNSRITIADAKQYNVQDLLKESVIMITDYSSVAFDFAYMDKPIIYYHFDYKAYRERQHPEGYFQYERDGMGPVYNDCKKIVDYLEKLIMNEGIVQEPYRARITKFFDLKDRNNCKRIFRKIEDI